MRGKFPLFACVVAAVLGLCAGAWPSVRASSFGGPDGPKMASAVTVKLADKTWPKPAAGSWTVPKAAGDGLPPVISRIETQDKVVFLTLDDGYEFDAEFVKIVREQQVPLMTFLTTRYLTGNGPYFWAIKHAGSPMENHTVNHADMKTLSAEGQRKEICGASDAIEQQFGRRPQVFRPPYGSWNDITRKVAQDCGMKSLLYWSAEYYNGTTSPAKVPDAFVRGDGGTGFKPGDIILMHYRKGLASHLTTMLGWLKEQGFRAAAIENYLPVSLGGNAPG